MKYDILALNDFLIDFAEESLCRIDSLLCVEILYENEKPHFKMRYEQNNSFESNLTVKRVHEIQEVVIFVLLNLCRNISVAKKVTFFSSSA